MREVIADPSYDLSALNKFITQQENVLRGPLTQIGNDAGSTTLQIDSMKGKPAKHSQVTTGQLPQGATTINTAKIYISGTLTNATAYRPA